jgi:hypothetical protein
VPAVLEIIQLIVKLEPGALAIIKGIVDILHAAHGSPSPTVPTEVNFSA